MQVNSITECEHLKIKIDDSSALHDFVPFEKYF